MGEMERDIKQIMQDIAESSSFNIEVMETDKDHLHMLVRSEQQISTSVIWKKYENRLRHIFYREKTFCTDGYFVSSIGNVSQETIRNYIENLG